MKEIFELRKKSLLKNIKIEDKKLALPIKLNILKRRFRQQLSLLKLMRKTITINIKKQPSIPSRDKNLGHIIKNI